MQGRQRSYFQSRLRYSSWFFNKSYVIILYTWTNQTGHQTLKKIILLFCWRRKTKEIEKLVARQQYRMDKETICRNTQPSCLWKKFRKKHRTFQNFSVHFLPKLTVYTLLLKNNTKVISPSRKLTLMSYFTTTKLY